MVSAINSALSGLDFASKKLEASANNIANQFSTDKSGKPFAPQEVQGVSNVQGGVDAVVKDAYKPSGSNADTAHGSEAGGGNDITSDLVNTQIASYDFKANLKTIQVANKNIESFLDIIS